MSDNAGCAWIFGLAVAGFVAIAWGILLFGETSARREQEVIMACVQNGGTWDGLWESCTHTDLAK